MLNKKTSIIICFAYTEDRKYEFNSEYLRSDLRSIVTFSHNQTGCLLENTYIITDILPVKKIQDEILDDFCTEVIKYLRELGGLTDSYSAVSVEYVQKFKLTPLQWLYNLCKQVTSKANASNLYNKIITTILPVIREMNAIEFASLFTNFIIITGKSHFDQTLRKIFSQPMTHLFFYYTGHGIRRWTNDRRSYDICLIIPGKVSEFYSRQDLRKKFELVLNNVDSFIIFDCCHAETILEFPHKLGFSEKQYTEMPSVIQSSKNYNINNNNSHIYLSSTCNNQTCGFYIPKNNQCGSSLFTYYLIKFLKKIGNNIDICRNKYMRNISLLKDVEENIQKYRKLSKKKPQNISISLSKNTITTLPLWLFENNTVYLVEQDK